MLLWKHVILTTWNNTQEEERQKERGKEKEKEKKGVEYQEWVRRVQQREEGGLDKVQQGEMERPMKRNINAMTFQTYLKKWQLLKNTKK